VCSRIERLFGHINTRFNALGNGCNVEESNIKILRTPTLSGFYIELAHREEDGTLPYQEKVGLRDDGGNGCDTCEVAGALPAGG
jgi:hypothetical protein